MIFKDPIESQHKVLGMRTYSYLNTFPSSVLLSCVRNKYRLETTKSKPVSFEDRFDTSQDYTGLVQLDTQLNKKKTIPKVVKPTNKKMVL